MAGLAERAHFPFAESAGSQERLAKLTKMVAQALQGSGVLGKMKAQLRASVYDVLQGKDRDVYNENLKVRSIRSRTNELLLGYLLLEYFDFYNMEFSRSVYCSESLLDVPIPVKQQGEEGEVEEVAPCDRAMSRRELLHEIGIMPPGEEVIEEGWETGKPLLQLILDDYTAIRRGDSFGVSQSLDSIGVDEGEPVRGGSMGTPRDPGDDRMRGQPGSPPRERQAPGGGLQYPGDAETEPRGGRWGAPRAAGPGGRGVPPLDIGSVESREPEPRLQRQREPGGEPEPKTKTKPESESEPEPEPETASRPQKLPAEAPPKASPIKKAKTTGKKKKLRAVRGGLKGKPKKLAPIKARGGSPKGGRAAPKLAASLSPTSTSRSTSRPAGRPPRHEDFSWSGGGGGPGGRREEASEVDPKDLFGGGGGGEVSGGGSSSFLAGIPSLGSRPKSLLGGSKKMADLSDDPKDMRITLPDDPLDESFEDLGGLGIEEPVDDVGHDFLTGGEWDEDGMADFEGAPVDPDEFVGDVDLAGILDVQDSDTLGTSLDDEVKFEGR